MQVTPDPWIEDHKLSIGLPEQALEGFSSPPKAPDMSLSFSGEGDLSSEDLPEGWGDVSGVF